MEKEGKKYLIKESELKEIIREMMLMELFNPDDYNGMYPKGSNPNAPLPTVYDYGSNILKAGGGLLSMAANAIIPDSWKEKAASGKHGQYLLSLLGAQKAGTEGADFFRNWGQARGEGSNADAHQQLDVNAAANWLRNNAHRKSTGWCARYVRMALNRGGLQAPHGMRAPSAKYYNTVLPANGWEKIPVSQAGEVGDVVVIGPCVDASGRNHPNGHIAMCIGGGTWASDFIQRTMHGLRGAPPPDAVQVYRYKNRV